MEAFCKLSSGGLKLTCASRHGGILITSLFSDRIRIGPLAPRVTVNGLGLTPASAICQQRSRGRPSITLRTQFAPLRVLLTQEFSAVDDRAIRLRTQLSNRFRKAVTLNSIRLLALEPGARVNLSKSPGCARIYEQGNYWARTRWLGESSGGAEADSHTIEHASSLCWVSFDLESRAAICVGFETEERWHGQILTEEPSREQPTSWSLGFDGGDLLIQPDESLWLEDVLLLAGRDPWKLLESYSELVMRRHGVRIPDQIPVSWCSWYPYRLGVTEERVLANAVIAAQRLKPLGMSIIQIDLGWQKGYLPSSFDENDQFPHGLAWLSDRLRQLGLRLGVWVAPFTISEFDPIAREHPEWLLRGEDGHPLPTGEWFWQPHGQTYVLDLTHPGARDWLRNRIRSLAKRGVSYLKADFLGQAGNPGLRRRNDPRMVAGGGTEASRVGLYIIQEELRAAQDDALLLNCSGPELPGRGSFPLLYACNDTGNTGYVGWDHHRRNYGLNLAGHLFKHRRWAIIQPSCLCVGPPGTLEEARVRATATFLSGGQVDVGDDLTVLPEDRWQILLSTLPPLGIAARPVDLFELVATSHLRYEAMCRGEPAIRDGGSDQIGSRIWHLRVSSSWDDWHLVGLFSYEAPLDSEGRPSITTFHLPLERLGLDLKTRRWAHEFWSGQFLGEIGARRESTGGYLHPGDAQALILSATKDTLKVSYFGPAVKLLIVRNARPHPWVVGTTFHQSGGTELSNVTWDPSGTLSGRLNRPAGQQGYLFIAGASSMPTTAKVADREVCPRPGANGSVVLPVLSEGPGTAWELSWKST